MRKGYLLTVLLLVLGLLLVACGGSSEPEEEAQPGGADTGTEEQGEGEGAGEGEEGAEAPEDREEVTLTFWHGAPLPPLEPTTNAMIDAFEEEYPWITVEVEGFPFGEYFTKVDTATAGGTAPDVFWVDVTEVPRYAYFNTIIPLDEFLPEGYLDDWYESPRNDMMYDGQVWAIPLHQSTEALLYNEDLIAEAGLEPPKSYDEAWDLETFREALEATTKVRDDGSVETYGFITNYTLSVYNWQPWIYAQGGTIMNEDRTTYVGHLDSDETTAAAEWFAQLYRDELAPVERVPDMFQTGNVAFFQSNPFGLVDTQDRYPDLNVGVMPLPCGERCAVASGGWHLGISSQSEHPEEAWLLVDYLTNHDGQLTWVQETGYLPARISVYEAMPELQEYPMNIFMEGLIDHAAPRPVTQAYQFFNQTMTEAIRDFNTGAPIAPALEEIAQEATQELENMQQ